MSQFSHEELEQAFTAHMAKVEDIRARAAWDELPELFTPDIEYVEHAYGTFHGREEVRAWAVRTMTTYPGNVMTGFPLAWYVIDAPTGRVICELRNLMPDLGDGPMIEESNITILTYAGDGLWSREEDVYNPMRFAGMARAWAKRAKAVGQLPDDAQSFVT